MADPSSIVWFGEQFATGVEDFPSDISYDKNKVATGSLQFNCQFTEADAFVESQDAHPDFDWLKKKGAKIKREEAGLGKVTIEYEGIHPETDVSIVRAVGNTTTEPIESHPNWLSKLGGAGPDHDLEIGGVKRHLGLNESMWDDKGKFIGFDFTNEDGSEINPFAGIKSYLAPSIVLEEVWTIGAAGIAATAFDDLGFISDPPEQEDMSAINGDSAAKYSWLLLSADYVKIGDGYKITRKWRRSGPRGWNDVIYTKADPDPVADEEEGD